MGKLMHIHFSADARHERPAHEINFLVYLLNFWLPQLQILLI